MDQQRLMMSKEDLLDRHIHLHIHDLLLRRPLRPRRTLRKGVFLGVLSGLILSGCALGWGVTLS